MKRETITLRFLMGKATNKKTLEEIENEVKRIGGIYVFYDTIYNSVSLPQKRFYKFLKFLNGKGVKEVEVTL